jgi:hypothetical protein
MLNVLMKHLAGASKPFDYADCSPQGKGDATTRFEIRTVSSGDSPSPGSPGEGREGAFPDRDPYTASSPRNDLSIPGR